MIAAFSNSSFVLWPIVDVLWGLRVGSLDLFLETCYVVFCFAGSVVIQRECSVPIQEDNSLRLQFTWRSVTAAVLGSSALYLIYRC